MNFTTASTIILNLVSTFVCHQQCSNGVRLIHRLDEYFRFDHHVFVMESATDLSRCSSMSKSSTTSVNFIPQTIYTFGDYLSSNVTNTFKTIMETKASKNQLVIVAVERLRIGYGSKWLTQVEAIRKLDISVKIGVFIADRLTSFETVEQLFRWSWSVGIVNIFCAFHLDANDHSRPSFNVFKYNPFGTFHLTNITHSEFWNYFVKQNQVPNFYGHPLRFQMIKEFSSLPMIIKFWSTVIRAFNASSPITYIGHKQFLAGQTMNGDVSLYEVLQRRYSRTAYPHRQTAFVLVVPHARPYSDFLVYLKNGTWERLFGLALIVVAASSLVLTVSAYLQKNKILLLQCIIDVINLLMNDNAAIRYGNLHRADVFVTVPLTFTGLIMMNGIVSLFKSYLMSPIYQPQINSLQDLYTSSVPIVANEIEWTDKISKMLNDVTMYSGWSDKIIGMPLDRLLHEIMAFNNTITFTMYEDEVPLYSKVQKLLGMKAYHVLRDTVFERISLTFEIRSEFPFTEQISNIVHRLNGAGLIDKWYKDDTDRFTKHLWKINLNHPLRIEEQLVVGEYSVLAVVWWGWAASSTVFVCEIIWDTVKSYMWNFSKRLFRMKNGSV